MVSSTEYGLGLEITPSADGAVAGVSMIAPAAEKQSSHKGRSHCWTCTVAPMLDGEPAVMTRYRLGVGQLVWTIWRIGPTAFTMAAPAGLVMKPASGSNSAAPLGSEESASTYGFLASRPVTAACSTWVRPWSNSETRVAGVPPAGPSTSWATWPATPSAIRFSVPAPSGTAFGT